MPKARPAPRRRGRGVIGPRYGVVDVSTSAPRPRTFDVRYVQTRPSLRRSSFGISRSVRQSRMIRLATDRAQFLPEWGRFGLIRRRRNERQQRQMNVEAWSAEIVLIWRMGSKRTEGIECADGAAISTHEVESSLLSRMKILDRWSGHAGSPGCGARDSRRAFLVSSLIDGARCDVVSRGGGPP